MRERVEEEEREGGRVEERGERGLTLASILLFFFLLLSWLLSVSLLVSPSLPLPLQAAQYIIKRDKNKDSTCPSSSSL